MSGNKDEVARLIQAIIECRQERDAVLSRYAKTLRGLKLELARVCGHRQVTHDWAWAQCTSCGYTDFIASDLFANALRGRQQA